MLKFLRLYYNYFLVKWGFRKVLPAYFINKIKVADCGEELVQYQGFWVRKRVAAMLKNAHRALPIHFEIKVVSGFRNDAEQNDLRKKFGNKQQVAAESGHASGGAVDVILLYWGKEADCGSGYLDFTSVTPTWSKELSINQKRNRFILYNAMTQAGFVNYPLEWWHFCYGDKMYAAYKFEKQAIYGKATLSWQPDLFKTE
ncbi:MAG: hypothetical protein E7053_07415 [Lentisphaerae bacterium]|nr:hypothetical protein [Lentisphaerota bacterium]